MTEKAGKNYVNLAEEEQKKLGDLLNEANNIINGTSNGSNPTINITTSYVGTTSFTVDVYTEYKKEEIEEYKYVIDGEEIISIDNPYTTNKELEPESTHKVQAIIKYKDGTTLKSNEFTVTTQPRTYIMKNGNVEAEGAILKNATLTPSIENNCVKLNIGPTKSRGGYVLPYNLSQYKKIILDVSINDSVDYDGLAFGIMDKDEDCFTTKKDEAVICTIKCNVTDKERYTLNTKDLEGICQIEIIKGATSNALNIDMNIYNLWLEK